MYGSTGWMGRPSVASTGQPDGSLLDWENGHAFSSDGVLHPGPRARSASIWRFHVLVLVQYDTAARH
jgi:hypothetical protein